MGERVREERRRRSDPVPSPRGGAATRTPRGTEGWLDRLLMDVLTLEGETAMRRLGALQAFLNVAKPRTPSLRSRLGRPRAAVVNPPAPVPASYGRTLHEVVVVRA